MDLLSETALGPRVLVVEDDPVSAKLIERHITSQNIIADVASSAEEALKLHADHQYNLVVSDWRLRGMSGVELCQEFRKMEGAYVYFILCSAQGERKDRLGAFAAGVDDFLSKPIDRAELLARFSVADRILSNERILRSQQVRLQESTGQLAGMNQALWVASRRFEELFKGLPVAAFTFDELGIIHEWNKAAEEAFGLSAPYAIQKHIWEIMGTHGPTIWDRKQVARIFDPSYQGDFDWTYDLPKGEKRYLACNVICLKGPDGSPVGAVCANLDVTDRKLAEQSARKFAEQLEQRQDELEAANLRLNHLAVTDGLTGLSNHRRFQELLEETIQEFDRLEQPFSLLIMDIDHFKKYNDTFGHQVGDAVLKQFATVLKTCSRKHEVPARYGGEEFAIILPQCDVERSLVVAERFRTAIASEDWPESMVTASIGVSTWKHGLQSMELIAQADAALYYSKQHGRNRSSHWTEMPDQAAA